MILFIKKFPDDLHYELKVLAAKRKQSLQALIIEILREWLTGKEGAK